jgi:outer membrane protein assembly factor BamA
MRPAIRRQQDRPKLGRRGLVWASPFGPLRFDYAVPLSMGKYDVVQQFKFGGGTSF